MRQDVEKLLLWLIPLLVISTIAETILARYVFELMGIAKDGASRVTGEINWLDEHLTLGQQVTIANWVKLVPTLIVHLVVGLWLFFQAQAKNANRWVWLFAGLFLKYWALALFLLTQLMENKATKSATANK